MLDMTIEQIDSNRILIALCDDDMKSFSLEFESMTLSDPHVKEMIQRLLKFASNETGISVKNKKMLIEAIPYINGCLFLITLSQKTHKRKIYKIKNPRPTIIEFIEIEDMLRCISIVYKTKIQYIHSDLYKYGSRYFLIIKPVRGISHRLEAFLYEYGEKISGGNLTVSKLREYGKIIAKDTAIEKIGKALVKK